MKNDSDRRDRSYFDMGVSLGCLVLIFVCGLVAVGAALTAATAFALVLRALFEVAGIVGG